MDKLLEMKLHGVRFDHLASVCASPEDRGQNLRPSWLVFSEGFKTSLLLSGAKRVIDILVALAGWVLAAPLMALVALAVRLSSPGPALYSQQRVGRDGRLFTVYKFRSMRRDAEAGTGAIWAQKNDSRVTAVGRVIRKTRLDETPQLWNVLRGDMSFVGPRPERPEFVRQLTEQIPFYGMRHVIRPGLPGGPRCATRADRASKTRWRSYGATCSTSKNLSIALDLFVILSTIKTVVLRKGAV